MKLIADCGSTKIDWCVLDGTTTVKQVFTCGMNAIMLTEEEMAQRIREELYPEVKDFAIDEVYFYGAGCISPEVCANVANAIRASIPASIIEVHTDLLAAARALCGHNPGIACIMGTGSNSCYYDGEKIVDNVSPLGYILGDEGSGAVLGKLLVGDVLKNQLPAHLSEKFLKQYDLDRLTIIRRVYKEPGGNRFLASVTPFLIQNIEEPAIHRLVLNSFKSFFVRNIANYDNYRNLPVNFVGSIAHYYQEVLREAAAAVDCHIGTIIKSPMEGLIKFHTAD
ncbi:MAG: ATPase [Barnesiella sp.]|nr:ATPase [Barnesiella sp.]MBD5249005.1 ATPase [Barnesiella sp.]